MYSCSRSLADQKIPESAWRAFSRFFPKLWTAVYPPRMTPFGLKLWQNAFRMIPDISFFDAEKKNPATFFVNFSLLSPPRKISKLPVLEELWIFGRQRQIRLEKSLPELWVSAFYDPWRRGKKGGFCFFRDFWPKKTYTLFAPKFNTMTLIRH